MRTRHTRSSLRTEGRFNRHVRRREAERCERQAMASLGGLVLSCALWFPVIDSVWRQL